MKFGVSVELVLLLQWWLKFVLVMEFVQVCAVFKLGFQVGVVMIKLGCSSRGVQVGVLWISWFPFFDGVKACPKAGQDSTFAKFRNVLSDRPCRKLVPEAGHRSRT
jgi:hypothetical protein